MVVQGPPAEAPEPEGLTNDGGTTMRKGFALLAIFLMVASGSALAIDSKVPVLMQDTGGGRGDDLGGQFIPVDGALDIALHLFQTPGVDVDQADGGVAQDLARHDVDRETAPKAAARANDDDLHSCFPFAVTCACLSDIVIDFGGLGKLPQGHCAFDSMQQSGYTWAGISASISYTRKFLR